MARTQPTTIQCIACHAQMPLRGFAYLLYDICTGHHPPTDKRNFSSAGGTCANAEGKDGEAPSANPPSFPSRTLHWPWPPFHSSPAPRGLRAVAEVPALDAIRLRARTCLKHKTGPSVVPSTQRAPRGRWGAGCPAGVDVYYGTVDTLHQLREVALAFV